MIKAIFSIAQAALLLATFAGANAQDEQGGQKVYRLYVADDCKGTPTCVLQAGNPPDKKAFVVERVTCRAKTNGSAIDYFILESQAADNPAPLRRARLNATLSDGWFRASWEVENFTVEDTQRMFIHADGGVTAINCEILAEAK